MPRAKTSAPAGTPVKVRVLVDCYLGKCNDVIEVDGAELDSVADVADADPAAVAYAETITKE